MTSPSAARPTVLLLGLFLALVTLVLPARAAESLNGVALVIGQSDYQHISALPNPANDARAMLKLLTDLGFDARSVSDRDAKKLSRDLERFVEDAEGADVAFLYYSGHGIEAGGENWLVPVDADIGSLGNAQEQLVSVSAVIEQLKETVPVSIVLLDACRTNPFPPDAMVKQTPTGSAAPISAGGLALVRGAKALSQADAGSPDNLGMVVGFAAEPGKPALDGPAGENSPYAAALLRHLTAMKGEEFGAVMRMVTEEVYLDTKARQRPWTNESLRRFLYFGVAPEEPQGDEALITGERRKLLLTISTLPDANRAQIEMVAVKDGVPLDALYGVLKALGTEKMPEDPSELEKLLDAQAARLKAMIEQRDALKADDPEIMRLTASADRAIREGAIGVARKFLNDAVARVEATRGAVDEAEELVKQKRLADAAVYAQRAAASALAFDYLAAAADYAKAYELVERWDDKWRWNYKNMEAEALHAAGAANGDRDALQRATEAYEILLGLVDRKKEERDWAITNNNLALVYETMAEAETDAAGLERAATMLGESLSAFEHVKDDTNWAAAQNNIGNVLLKLGQRDKDTARLEQSVAAFRAALEKRSREELPLDWAGSQNNIGIALFSLAEREADDRRLVEAEAAYRLALEVYTREKTPVEWALVQNNLGNTLNTLGTYRNDPAQFQAAAAAFRAALEVRTRETLPRSWAISRLNLASALSNSTKFDLGTDVLEEAAAALRDAQTVFTREAFPLDWAAAQNNLGTILHTLGQRNRDPATLDQAVETYRGALRVYKRKQFPLDWAMTKFNLGYTLQLAGGLGNQPSRYREAVAAYKDALGEYSRDATPRQWALAKAGMGSALQWLSTDEQGTKSLMESILVRREALEVLTAENAPIDWATVQNGLGMSLLNLGTLEQTAKYLLEAEAAFQASLKVFTREEQPLQWAFGQNNLGDVHWNLASQGGGKPEYQRAKDYFERAKQGFVEAGYPLPIPLTEQKIELVENEMAGK